MNPTAKTCRLLTLGCKVNQYETEHLRETLEANGYTVASSDAPPDLVVVNTCTVTHEADAKARQMIRQLARQHPATRIVVMGCYATREPATLARLPNVAKVITDKTRAVEDLREFGVTKSVATIGRFADHQRAFVKVQDGCLLNCSFCIIPTVRTVVRSRPMEEVASEAARLIANGYREIVLTGIHLGHYGIDLSRGRPKSSWTRLWHLVERLSALEGDFRLRLSSLEAAECRRDLLSTLKGNPRVCPHLHLCLQSGSDRILGLMRRRHGVAGFLERCQEIRAVLDEPAITTDVIVGFPGETEADFAATCAVARQAGFAKMHVFPFSPRRGTPAATMPHQVSPEVLARRKDELSALDRELTERHLRGLVGKRLDLLVEGGDARHAGWVRGTTCRGAVARVRGGEALIRQRVPVVATGVDGDCLVTQGIPEDHWVEAATRRTLPILKAV